MDKKEKPKQQELEERITELEKKIAGHEKKVHSYSKWLDDQACERRLDFYSRKDIWLESETYENARRGFNALFSSDYDSNNELNFGEYAKHMKEAICKYYQARIKRFKAENPGVNPYAPADRPGTIIIIDD